MIKAILGKPVMATLRQYFDTDFNRTLSGHRPRNFTINKDKNFFEVVERLHYDFDANAKYISYYIPAAANIAELCCYIIDNPEWALSITKSAEVSWGYLTDQIKTANSLIFTNQFIFYIDELLNQEDIQAIVSHGNKKGFFVQIRDKKYATKRTETEIPLAFISHDSRDKDNIARPLAIELSKLMITVWYDEFSLKVGDSLRESIEKGIKECKKCILILTPNYLSNSGWTKQEFNSIFTREIIEKKNIVLPIWDKVTKQEVFNYSPNLADRFAARWNEGQLQVASKVARAIRKV